MSVIKSKQDFKTYFKGITSLICQDTMILAIVGGMIN